MLRKLLDSNNSIGWIIASIGIIMVGMFSIIFIPVIMSLTRFQTKTNIGFTPNEGIYFYLVLAFLVLAVGFYLIYRVSKKWNRIFAGISGFLMFGVLLYFAYNQYTYIDENYIEIGTGYGSKQYTWDQVEEASYYSTADNIESYVLVMKDGKEIEVVFGGLLQSDVKVHVKHSVEDEGVKIIDRS